MNTRQRFAIAAGFVLVAALVGILAAPSLPDRLVTHWNAAGVPNDTMSKPVALAFAPVLAALLLALFAAIPRIDPRRENIQSFRPYYDWLVVIITGFIALVHVGVIAFNLGYEFDFTLLILAAVAFLFYYIGILLTHAERNWFVGVRTPWTLSSDVVWTRTHVLAGRLFKLTAVISLVGLLFGEYAIYFLLVPALVTSAITVVYSYYLYEQVERGTDPSTDSL
ncbi:SdpI family protein [Haladaptatus sp. DJG-WS-42]|uniref:SdpI family protein n=1 Tax=Haladaptatus sp. DJG-WS-42 TaxID=3120516 RepID=UPI0030CB54C5